MILNMNLMMVKSVKIGVYESILMLIAENNLKKNAVFKI